MSLGHEQQRVASYNAAQQSAQLTLQKDELIGGIGDLLNRLCIFENRQLLHGYFQMHNLPYTIFDGTNVCISQPKEGRRIKILCIWLGYS